MKLPIPEIRIKDLNRGPDYPKPYRAIISFGSDNYHVGEAATPAEALLLAAVHWRSWEDTK